MDREKVIKELINLPTMVYDGFYQLRITHDLRDETVKLLKEQDAKEQLSDAVHETAKQFRQTIVRCKDCEYSYTEGFVHPHLICEKYPELGSVADDWFCADGWKA